MTIYVQPFLVYMFGFWAANARAEQATEKWDKRLWALVRVALAVAMLFAVFGHARWSR